MGMSVASKPSSTSGSAAPVFSTSEPIATENRHPGLRRIQGRDLAWLLFTAGLIFSDPETNYNATIILAIFGAFQIIEPRVRFLSSRRGQILSIAFKMLLSWLLLGYSHTVDSFYYLIFLIPVISAGTVFGALGVSIVTGIASVGYFAFLLPIFINWSTFRMPPGLINVMCLNACFYAIAAFVVYQQAKATREEMRRTQLAAERLAESNRSLQEAQASLRRSERLAALGQLTAGLAHELRNPLGTIKASAEMLTKPSSRERPEVMTEVAAYIGSEADRMNGLVSRFLEFARPLELHAVAADLRATIEELLRTEREAQNHGVELVLHMKEGPLIFEFDPDLLRIALSNLVHNAVQASAPGTRVEIRAEDRDTHVVLLVTDHGEGIQSQHLENIFNPFFTTKPQGVGLGLAIVSKIVDEHRGHIAVFSEPGTGTTFELTLPKFQQS
jgi:two-component system sensor histidine kinase HydH